MFWYLTIYVLLSLDVILTRAQVPVSQCQDVDSNACKLFQDKDPDICNQSFFRDNTCQRFCDNCPRECYYCENAVLDAADCNTTKACAPNMYCMTKTLVNENNLKEYIMTCAEKQICDGLAVGFPLGKRSAVTDEEDDFLTDQMKSRRRRYLAFECCDSDFCNMPSH